MTRPDDIAPLSDGQQAQVDALAALIRDLGAAALAEALVRRGVLAHLPAVADGCSCSMAPPSQWFTYGSAVEPGSQWAEQDPGCPEHSEHVWNPRTGSWQFADPEVQAAWEQANALAAGNTAGTVWAEVPF